MQQDSSNKIKSIIANQTSYITHILWGNKKKHLQYFISPSLVKCSSIMKHHIPDPDLRKEHVFLSEMVKKIDASKVVRCYWKLNQEKTYRKFQHRYSRYQKVLCNSKTKKNYYLSITCIIQNEREYIKEWIEFHRLVGVEHFFLFDNESSDSVLDVLGPYIQSDIVTYIYFPGRNAQIPAYQYSLKHFGSLTHWMMLIDADEFVFPTESLLPDFLKKYEDYPGIGINWIVYGPGPHIKKPRGLVTENYTQTFYDRNNLFNLRIKSIVKPSMVLTLHSPHFCLYHKNQYAVDENYNPITQDAMLGYGIGYAFTSVNQTEKIRINHYWTKSQQEFQIKCHRGYADGQKNAVFDEGMKRFNYPMIDDYSIFRFIPQLKNNLIK